MTPLDSIQHRALVVQESIDAVAFSPDSMQLAIAGRHTVWTGDLETERVTVLGRARDVRAIAWTERGVVATTHDGAKSIGRRAKKPKATAPAIAVNLRGNVVVYDGDATELVKLGHDGVAAIAAAVIAICERDGVTILDAATWKPIARHALTDEYMGAVALSPDGARIVVSSQCGALEGPIAGPLAYLPECGSVSYGRGAFAIGDAIYRTGSARPLRTRGQNLHITISPDGTRAAIVEGSVVRVVELAALEAAPAPCGPVDTVIALAVDRSRDRVAAIDKSGLVCVWRSSDATLVSTFTIARGDARGLAFADDGALLVGSYGIDVWDPETGQRRATHRIDTIDEIRELMIAGDRVVVNSYRSVAVLARAGFATTRVIGPWWNADDARRERYDAWRIQDVALSADGARCAIAFDRHPTQVVDCATGAVVRELAPPATAVAFGGDSGSASASIEPFIACSAYNDAELVGLADGASESIPPFSAAVPLGDGILWWHGQRVGVRARGANLSDFAYRDAPSRAAVAVDPARFLTASAAKWIGERALDGGGLRRVFGAGASGRISALAFDPTGERLAVGESEGRVHVWQLGAAPARIGMLDGTTLQPDKTIAAPGDVGEIHALAFTATALVACSNRVLRWDARDLSDIGRGEHTALGDCHATRISLDGARLFRGTSFGSEWKLYDAADGAELASGPAIDARDRFDDLTDDGRRLLVGGCFGKTSELTVYEDHGARVGTLRIDGHVAGTCFDSRGRVLGWILERGPLFRWDPSAETVERWCDPPPIARFNLRASARSPGRIVLANGHSQTVVDDDTGAVVIAVPDLAGGATAVALSHDGRRLAIGTWSGDVRIYELGHRARCVAALSGTTNGGWWAIGSAGYTHVAGDWKQS